MSHRNTDAARIVEETRAILSFTYHSIQFDVAVGQDTAAPSGQLRATVGVMPFTVHGASLRRNMLALIDHARETLGYHVRVGNDHAIELAVALPVSAATPIDTILAAAMEKLAGAKPFLDLVQTLQPPRIR